MTRYVLFLKILFGLGAMSLSGSTFASGDDEDQAVIEEIVVTASMRVTAGGAQDVSYVRSEIIGGRIPHPDGLTAEGLLSEYDLSLKSSEPCYQLFCLFYEAVKSDLVSKPNDTLMVGLGFATNVEAASWQRAPINLVAVIDKSGSMKGTPLARVKKALAALLQSLQPTDQLSIVLYGDRSYVHLSPTSAERKNLPLIEQSIRQISSSGSTNMEEGLEVGIELAYQTQTEFDGKTRLMLFTDERPNVGDTSAEGFIGMTRAASERGVGLTTIGVGVQFDAELATKISSSRGGNLFFLDTDAAAKSLFSKEFDYMVSELAHDLKFSVRAHPSHQITGVYGVPRDMLSWENNETVSFTLPTLFLSKRGGGIFVTLAPSDQFANLPSPEKSLGTNVLSVAITYSGAEGLSPGSDSIEIARTSRRPSRSMQLASLLVDEYLSFKSATTDHYVKNDQESAYQTMSLLNQRMNEIRSRWLLRTLEKEIETTDLLLGDLAFLAGHAAESSRHTLPDLLGVWRIDKVRGDDWMELEKGALWVFGPNRILMGDAFNQGELDWSAAMDSTYTANRLAIPEEEIVSTYRLKGRKLDLNFHDEGFRVRLTKIAELPDAGRSM